ncbi:hypothetical protein ONE63_003115 [Megalurothrips usitatus]|uniref:Uncharacterized protein n=1 Tax=Megalurothrips usitatus TaxID=439358 RepID=A0AAV7X9T7_9NEOP|nr:hypothetical protein ONE63_003115 [Megalurothrips usitatus]
MTASGQPHERRLRWLRDAVEAVPEAGGARAAAVAAGLRHADLFLSYRNNHPACRVLERLLAALLPASTSRLDMTVAGSYVLREAVLRRLQALPQLRVLTLSESLHVHTNAALAASGLSALRRLRSVRAPWVCSDDMALALARHCPELEAVDASESARVTDRGAAALSSAPALRVAVLSGCRLTPRGYELLLGARPSLQRLGRVPALGAVVHAAAAAAAGAPLALTEWDSDHAPSAADAALCPAVASVCLSDVAVLLDTDGGAPLLPAGVRRLRVSWVGLRDHPAPLRLRLPAALTALDMMGHMVTVADAVLLGRQCPALRVLKLTTLCQDAAAPVPEHPAKAAPFRHLREFHLAGAGPLLEYVLRHAPALVRLSVTPGLPGDAAVPPWTDADMRRVVAANPLPELESFRLACPCELTMATVYLLVLGCPRLRALLDLNEWAVTDEERAELLEVAAANNWDLELGLTSGLAVLAAA